MKLSSILLIHIICQVWESISPGFIADKNRRAVKELTFPIEGCRREGSCVLKVATLKVYFRVKRTCQRKVKILLQITQGRSRKHYPVTISKSGWQEFDVKNIMSWLSKSKQMSKKTFYIKCQGCKGKMKLAFKGMLRKPKLIWRVEETAALSNKARYCSQAERKCCLRRKVVVFDDRLQWHGRILIPHSSKTLTVNECSGVCDIDQVHHSAYAQLLARMQQRTPCCVPTKLSAVSVFISKAADGLQGKQWLDVGNVEQKELNLVAEECGCM